MAATIYGDGIWGMEDETGLYAQNFDYDFSIQEVMISGVSSEDVAGALFGQEASFSLSGFLKDSVAFSGTLGASLVGANAVDMSDFVKGYTTGGQTYITGLKPGGEVRNFQTLDVSGKFKPFLAAEAS